MIRLANCPLSSPGIARVLESLVPSLVIICLLPLGNYRSIRGIMNEANVMRITVSVNMEEARIRCLHCVLNFETFYRCSRCACTLTLKSCVVAEKRVRKQGEERSDGVGVLSFLPLKHYCVVQGYVYISKHVQLYVQLCYLLFFLIYVSNESQQSRLIHCRMSIT